MEIYKIPACWPTTFINGIPVSDMLLKENLMDKKYKCFQSFNIKLDQTLIDFIFQFCHISNLSQETAQASIIVFEYYANHSVDLSKFDMELVAMTSILLCSKMFDVKPLTLNTLHRISAHVYNNSMVLNCEIYILKIIDFDLFLRDNLLVDKIGLYLESIRLLLKEDDFKKFSSLCFKISNLIYEDFRLIKGIEFNLLCASIIQAGLVIATKREGKLPVTIKVSIVSGCQEENILKCAKKIIKHCLGKNVYKQFNF